MKSRTDKIVDFFLDIPAPESRLNRLFVPTLLITGVVHYATHYYILYVASPENYHPIFIHIMDFVEANFRAASSWRSHSKLLGDLMIPIYTTSLFFGLLYFIASFLFTNGLLLIGNSSHRKKDFFRAAIVVAIMNMSALYVFFLTVGISQETGQRNIGILRLAMETKPGNLFIIPLITIIYFWWFGISAAWARLMAKHHLRRKQ